MISSLLHLVGLRPRVYYTLTNFRGGGGPRPPWPPPPQYANVYCNYYHLVGTPRPNFGNRTQNNNQISDSQHQNNSDGDNNNHVDFSSDKWLRPLASQNYYWFCVMCTPILKCSLGSLARLSTLS